MYDLKHKREIKNLFLHMTFTFCPLAKQEFLQLKVKNVKSLISMHLLKHLF